MNTQREFHEAMAPYTTDGEYVDNRTDDVPERIEPPMATVQIS